MKTAEPEPKRAAPAGPSPIVRPVHGLRPWLLGLLFWAALVPLTARPRHSGNVWSRYMTIESLVERGTWAIDASPLRAISGSPDLIRVGAHFYSDKPPVLSALGAVVYFPLWVSGWRMGRTPQEFVTVNWVLVLTLVGGASALAIVGVRRLLQCAPVRPLISDALTLGFGLGSLMLVYGVTFNNHSVAAGLLTYAVGLVAFEEPSRGSSWPRAVAGLLAGLAATIDLPAGGAMIISLGAWLSWRDRSLPAGYLAGCAVPLLLHAALQSAATGTPLPAEMTPEVFNYPGSYWLTEAGRWRERGPRWRFGLELLFGPQGWLTMTPALAFGVIALARIATRRGDPLRPAAIAVGATVAVLMIYYTWGVRRTDFAGQSFGTRHLLAISPAVFALGVIGLGRLRNRVAWGIFAATWLVGAVFAYAGLQAPWSRVENRQDSGLLVVRRLTLYPWSSYTR